MNRALIPLLLLFAFASCTDKDTPSPDNTQPPVILKLSTDKTEIAIGEAARLSCEATGGGLSYEWQVALGDILPVSADGSVVDFSGSECCSGEKTIMCTVSNDKGKDTQYIVITLKES